MSVPRTEARQRETAERMRRPVHRPDSGPDRDPLLPGLVTPGLSCGRAAASEVSQGRQLQELAVVQGEKAGSGLGAAGEGGLQGVQGLELAVVRLGESAEVDGNG